MNKKLLSVGLGLAAIGAVGVAHLPYFRGAGCPFAHAPSASELETLRQKSAASLRGADVAAARPAFGFALDHTTRADVLAWGTSAGATCEDALGGAAIRCEQAHVSGELVSDAFFRFDPQGRLVGVDVMREGQPPAKAGALFERIETAVARDIGPPAHAHGEASEAALGKGYLATAAAEFRFVDYAADVSVTNMGAQGVIVREQYRSLATR